MNRFIPYYYLLFVLLVTGAFASMAQNAYGQFILGVVAASFTLLFCLQWIALFNRKERNWPEWLEITGLVILSIIMTLRVFYIYFKGVEWIFIVATGGLLLIYSFNLVRLYSADGIRNTTFKRLLFVFYLCLILYLFSMMTMQFMPSVSPYAGYIAFGLLVLFMAGGWFSGEMLEQGEKINVFQVISRSEDKSVLLLSLFLIFSLYMGFTSLNILPKMYSNEYPQAYYKLLSTTGNKEMSSAELRKKQEEFKNQYDALVKKHLKNIQ